MATLDQLSRILGKREFAKYKGHNVIMILDINLESCLWRTQLIEGKVSKSVISALRKLLCRKGIAGIVGTHSSMFAAEKSLAHLRQGIFGRVAKLHQRALFTTDLLSQQAKESDGSPSDNHVEFVRQCRKSMLDLLGASHDKLDAFVHARFAYKSHDLGRGFSWPKKIPRHFKQVLQLLGEPAEHEHLAGTLLGAAKNAEVLFNDARDDGAFQPLYEALKPLNREERSVTVIVMWLVFWAGMRSRCIEDNRALLPTIDELFVRDYRRIRGVACEALKSRNAILLAGVPAVKGHEEAHVLAALRSCFKVARWLALSSEGKRTNLLGIRLTARSFVCEFGVHRDKVWDRVAELSKRCVSMLTEHGGDQLGGAKGSKPDNNKELCRELVCMMLLLNSGMGGMDGRTCAPFINQDGEVLQIGFGSIEADKRT